ncbi:hypothetical protein CT688_05470 [Dietzia sp. JS16-p6b]|nr:hypothetical protein CT688_05470 [Dietzia sp. JS16-p6b]
MPGRPAQDPRRAERGPHPRSEGPRRGCGGRRLSRTHRERAGHLRVDSNGPVSEVPAAERADPGDPLHVAAPFSGVVTITVGVGDEIEPGGTVATIEAMKMEAAITSPGGGTVDRIAINTVGQVEAGDLIVVLT